VDNITEVTSPERDNMGKFVRIKAVHSIAEGEFVLGATLSAERLELVMAQRTIRVVVRRIEIARGTPLFMLRASTTHCRMQGKRSGSLPRLARGPVLRFVQKASGVYETTR
jgi:hypothetical protein